MKKSLTLLSLLILMVGLAAWGQPRARAGEDSWLQIVYFVR